MNTAMLKDWIRNTILADSALRREVEEHLDGLDEIEDKHLGAAYWKRTSKSKIRSDEEYDWLLEGHLDFGLVPNIPSLKGCVVRQFLHTHGDVLFGIITDPTDTNIVAWALQAD